MRNQTGLFIYVHPNFMLSFYIFVSKSQSSNLKVETRIFQERTLWNTITETRQVFFATGRKTYGIQHTNGYTRTFTFPRSRELRESVQAARVKVNGWKSLVGRPVG